MGENGLPVSLGLIIAAAVLGALLFIGIVVYAAINTAIAAPVD